MKETFKTFVSLIILLLISSLIYAAWILNKGEFSSVYLEKFINERFKSDNFYTSIEKPIIRFDKKERRIVIDGYNFSIFSNEKKKLSEFNNLKIHINFLPLITERKLVTNKIEMQDGMIDLPNVFSKKLKIEFIKLNGDLNPSNEEIKIDTFSTSINGDFYEGFANLNMTNFEADGELTKLSRKKIFYDLDLDSKNMKFSVNKKEFNIKGDAMIGGVDVFIEGKKNYLNKSKFISKYNITGKVNEEDFEKSFNFKIIPYSQGLINLKATYFIFQKKKEKIITTSDLKDVKLSIPTLGIIKDKGVDAKVDIDFNFSNKILNEIKINNYKDTDNEINGLIKLSKNIKPYKSLELNLEKNNKKINIKILRDKNLNNLYLKGDYLDLSKSLEETFFEEPKEDSFLVKLQPLDISLQTNEALVAEEKSIYNVDGILKYDNKIFKEVNLTGSLKNQKTFNINIVPKENSRELKINSDDAGLFLRTFNINKSGNEGSLVLHGNYDDTRDSHPLNASLTIRDMRLIKAPTLAKILNLASIGIVSALSGEGILINKLKSEFTIEKGILELNKYEAYGPDVGFSNQGKILLKEKEIDLEGAIIPMVTLNKIIGSIPVLGKILTNERKGIWSFIYTIKGDLDEPEVKVDPIKTITPGFIQKFFSVFKKEDKNKNN